MIRAAVGSRARISFREEDAVINREVDAISRPQLLTTFNCGLKRAPSFALLIIKEDQKCSTEDHAKYRCHSSRHM